MLLPDALTLGGAAGLVTAPLRRARPARESAGAAFGFLVVWLPFDLLYRRLRDSWHGSGRRQAGRARGRLVRLARCAVCAARRTVLGTLIALVVYVARGRWRSRRA